MPFPHLNRTALLLGVFIIICASIPCATYAATTDKPSLPTIEAILENIDTAFAQISDISGQVDVEQIYADGSVVQAQVKVDALLSGVLRMTFLKPDTFAGSIFIFNKKSNRAIQYSPLTEQAINQSIDQVLTDRSVFASVDQLFSLPSPDDYELTVLAVETINKVSHVVVSAQSKTDSDSWRYRFWINQQTWLASKLQITDKDNKPVMVISINGIKLNQNLKEATLNKLPAGTQYINR